MKNAGRKQTIALLRSYPLMKNAAENLNRQICLQKQLVDLYHRVGYSEEDGEGARVIFIYENLQIQRKLLLARIAAIDRCMNALSERERDILKAFFMTEYDRNTPFSLMERCGYEKSQLYYIRGRALTKMEEELKLMGYLDQKEEAEDGQNA